MLIFGQALSTAESEIVFAASAISWERLSYALRYGEAYESGKRCFTTSLNCCHAQQSDKQLQHHSPLLGAPYTLYLCHGVHKQARTG
ncbi:hypothetical protein HaLaN_13070 [Haematococcus lacustris]|uniref:Uncharacterized protein n=1 Tax=Haematococcus lacustris TaxID=44745 RepID=A0A699ZCA1_HAELA|nr:hypothetical protein HaLaN_13070 [Haematococcus lacustris]